jgi:hypothetical protein
MYNIDAPEVTSAACSCGHEQEMPKHITVFCPRYQDTREQLRINGHLDSRELQGKSAGSDYRIRVQDQPDQEGKS